MTRVLSLSTHRSFPIWLAFVLALAFATFAATNAVAAEVTQNKGNASTPQELDDDDGHGSVRSDRVIVTPEPSWGGWGEWHDGWNEHGPRVDVWVDRGDWSVYRPGDRLDVFFRVDRSCYVTILDYAPDGSVSVLFPNRWSGSNFVRAGRTYRLPESRMYSLRIAGSGGEETLFACAHSAPWPSVSSGGYWIPPYHPYRGRVIVGRPGGNHPPGRRHGNSPWRHGRVVVGSGCNWPVPPDWRDRRDRWGCDSVTFHVESGYPWSSRGSGWRDGYEDQYYEHGDDGYAYGGHDYGDGRTVFRDDFRMGGCSDSYYRNIERRGSPLVLNIECVESRSGDATEIVGRIVWEDGWGNETLFRIDVEGKHGDRPAEGRVYAARTGDLVVEIEVDDFRVDEGKPWQLPRIKWIEFDIRVLDD
ncbi:MAG: DUF4384 domain-containing protein [Candidatus Eisenbacteria bacterium]